MGNRHTIPVKPIVSNDLSADKTPNNNLKKWINADIISILALLVNFGLAIFTYKLYVKASDDSKRADQIFKMSNEPFLQLYNCKLDTFVVGKYPTVSFLIENLGAYPVKVLSAKILSTTRNLSPHLEDIEANGNNNIKLLNTYVMKEAPSFQSIMIARVLDRGSYLQVMTGHWFYWLGGTIKYQNLETQEIKTYNFIIRMNPFISEFVVNDNFNSESNTN